MKALEVRVGQVAAKRLEREGWHADLIDGLIGASGGSKWLILGRLDRVLMSDLLSGRSKPLDAVGSSIGQRGLPALLPGGATGALYGHFRPALARGRGGNRGHCRQTPGLAWQNSPPTD